MKTIIICLILALLACREQKKPEVKKTDYEILIEKKSTLLSEEFKAFSSRYPKLNNMDSLDFIYSISYQNTLKDSNTIFVCSPYFVDDIVKRDSGYLIKIVKFLENNTVYLDLFCNEEIEKAIYSEGSDSSNVLHFLIVNIDNFKKVRWVIRGDGEDQGDDYISVDINVGNASTFVFEGSVIETNRKVIM